MDHKYLVLDTGAKNHDESLCEGGQTGITRRLDSKSSQQAAGKPFAIPAFSNCYICISDARHISELRSAPSDQLSFYGFLQQVRPSIFFGFSRYRST